MSKRQRSDREVVTACDLADAIEEIQNVVTEFTVENVLNRTREINRLLREIPQNMHQLYSILKPHSWYVEVYTSETPQGNLLVQIPCNPVTKADMMKPFLDIGFQEWEAIPDTRYFTVCCNHPNPTLFASQLMMLRDKHLYPMLMLGRNYTLPSHATHYCIYREDA